jgi:hypothetical protein
MGICYLKGFMKTEIVRIGVTNNFNCTEREWAQVDRFAKANPNKVFFVNSNIRTPRLATIARHPYRCVITVNPDLNITHVGIASVLKKLTVIKKKIAFVRVKYLPNNENINLLIGMLIGYHYPIVLTLQRFNGKESLLKYTKLEYYKFSFSRYRLAGQELFVVTEAVKEMQRRDHQMYICDIKGEGCGGCGLCSKLTTGKDLKISSLNLSTSGICPYNCCDCFAKSMQKFARAIGNRPIIYDKIKQNDKQAGRLEHIKKILKNKTVIAPTAIVM